MSPATISRCARGREWLWIIEIVVRHIISAEAVAAWRGEGKVGIVTSFFLQKIGAVLVAIVRPRPRSEIT
jgi:hypothetical protein